MALTDKLTAIADAIRAKTGGTETLTLDQMVTEIGSISTGGGSGGVSLDAIVVFVADYYEDEVIVETGAINKYERTIIS